MDNPTGAQMLKKRPTVEQNVKQILIDYPSTKGDDLLLIYRYWHRHDKIRITFKRFMDLFHATCPETIRRTRQLIQSKYEDLRPTKRVRRKRVINQEAHKNYYGSGLKLTDYIN